MKVRSKSVTFSLPVLAQGPTDMGRRRPAWPLVLRCHSVIRRTPRVFARPLHPARLGARQACRGRAAILHLQCLRPVSAALAAGTRRDRGKRLMRMDNGRMNRARLGQSAKSRATRTLPGKPHSALISFGKIGIEGFIYRAQPCPHPESGFTKEINKMLQPLRGSLLDAISQATGGCKGNSPFLYSRGRRPCTAKQTAPMPPKRRTIFHARINVAPFSQAIAIQESSRASRTMTSLFGYLSLRYFPASRTVCRLSRYDRDLPSTMISEACAALLCADNVQFPLVPRIILYPGLGKLPCQAAKIGISTKGNPAILLVSIEKTTVASR